MIAVKICGLSTPEAVEAALAGGASFIGFAFFAASPRNVTPASAARLAAMARGRASIVALAVDPDDALLQRLADELAPDFIQLHGRESPSRLAQIGRRFSRGLIKALPVSDSADLAVAHDYEELVDHLMFDAKPAPGADRPGGLGAPFDWSLLKDAVFQRPWFLAGGLNPWNVADALAQSGAPMVDVSSGVERGAGLKDPALIGAFLEAVRRA